MASDSSDFTAATYVARFDQLRSGECGDNCCLDIQNDIDGDGSRLVSGPCFKRSSPIPPVFDRCFPRSREELLPFQLPTVRDVWTAESQRFRGFPSFDPEFYRWYRRMTAQDRITSLWKKAGIERALQFSCFDWNLNLGLLGSVVCLWSPSTNCFFFPWGPMSITLLDVHAIAGFMPTGLAVKDIGSPRYLESIDDNALSYGSFMNTFRQPSGQVEDDEHTAFLLYWLSKGITHASLAMRGKESGTFFGSFWLLQAWIVLYFPFLFSNRNHELPKYNNLSLQPHVPEFIGSQLLSRLPLPIPEGNPPLTYFLRVLFDFDRDKFDFCPFKSESFSYLYRFPSREEFGDFWVKVLTPVDLPLRLSKKGRFYHGFEIYSPQYCARQFGLAQGIPMPIYYSLEFPFTEKTKYKSTENGPFSCCSEITESMYARFSVDEFSPDPQSTPDYDQWWGLYYRRYFINARSALKRIKPFTSPIKGKSVGQGEEDELHSQQSVEPKLLTIEENEGSLDGLPMSTAQVQSPRPRSRKKKSRARRGKAVSQPITPLRTRKKRSTGIQITEGEKEMEEVPLSRKKRRVVFTSASTGDDVEEIENTATGAGSNPSFSIDDITRATNTSPGPEGTIVLTDKSPEARAAPLIPRTECSLRSSSLESASLVSAPSSLAGHGSTDPQPTITSATVEMNNQNQLEGVTNALGHALSIRSPSVPLLLPAPPSGQTGENFVGSSVRGRLILEELSKARHLEAASCGTLASDSSAAHIQAIKRKWAEFFELSVGGYSLLAANPITADRVKILLEELYDDDIQFSKSQQFKERCKIFLEQFLGGMKAYQYDKEKITSLTALEEKCLQSLASIKELDQSLQGNENTLQTLIDEQVNLATEEAELEKRLADVRHRRGLVAGEISQVNRTLERDLDAFKTLPHRKSQLAKELADHRHAKNQLVVRNGCLDIDMSSFHKEAMDFVNNL
ncbi:uncharacterized protein LOC130135866 isoform X2 [Syzygium oleosum]|uniref:uncharacterized protein LOC130135866 isoform X2 n=1 Tax=Syzygium oleosum TaxID=219896 RepID=UPI0024B9834F|nr:uncharacterized protein LOC130135866 isoform X2 [Syzygium oleosum]